MLTLTTSDFSTDECGRSQKRTVTWNMATSTPPPLFFLHLSGSSCNVTQIFSCKRHRRAGEIAHSDSALPRLVYVPGSRLPPPHCTEGSFRAVVSLTLSASLPLFLQQKRKKREKSLCIFFTFHVEETMLEAGLTLYLAADAFTRAAL